MAFSAYDEEGRLKKNALQSTGLGAATDQATVKQRKQFEELHDEARRTGATEDEMKGILQSRMNQYAGDQQGRMAQIAEQRGAMEARYAATGDAETERRFDLQSSGGPRPEEYRLESRAAWEEAGGAAGKYKQGGLKKSRSFKDKLGMSAWMGDDVSVKDAKKLEKNFLKDNPDLYKMTSKKQLKAFRGEIGDEKFGLRKSQRRSIEKKNERHLKNFRRDRWNSLYDWEAEKAYNQRRQDVAAEIDKSYIGLGEESEERQALIENKLELYNMFLGE